MVRAFPFLLLLATQQAVAQIQLPPVRVPDLPQVDRPVDVGGTVSQATRALDPNQLDLTGLTARELRELRRLRIRELLRTHRRVIDADPRGAPIVRNEVLALSPSAEALERARAAGYTILRERPLEGLEGRIIVFQAPEGLSARRALERLRRLDPQGQYDFNHIYLGSGEVSTRSDSSSLRVVTAEPVRSDAARTRVGLIDTGVNAGHPVFRDVAIRQHGCDGKPVPAAHGTAVASLIVGRGERFRGAVPGSDLYAADVYCGAPTGGAVDAVADALAWMAKERVPVINVSLVGPPNALLRGVVQMMVSRGHVIVAAVGNDGPSAPPLYPAAYPGVIAVTGVDARQKALLEAGRGKHILFAAPGADMAAASFPQPYSPVRGTSFAAPIVAGLIAARLQSPDKLAADRAVSELGQQAIDLGARGPDPVYGRGMVGERLRVEPALALLNGGS